jgi:hypothetical protein
MLDPININFFLPFIFALINCLAALVHLDMFPSINFSEDFPWPEYSNFIKPIFFEKYDSFVKSNKKFEF